MKLIISLLFSAVIFAASFQNSLFMIDYQINRDYYEIHCINKAKSSLECHGKCQMKKESERSSNAMSLVKYSFEFNILPGQPFDFPLKSAPAFIFKSIPADLQAPFFKEAFEKVLPHPPQFSLRSFA
ncbi:hypothetical protein [Kaistella palustris]|uniref:hypothetical protein n=1 Tax=Kaistella palustris TaxID=493376 RepID=UPI00048553B8|nr:hypothetical protein [Kaistella palustris]